MSGIMRFKAKRTDNVIGIEKGKIYEGTSSYTLDGIIIKIQVGRSLVRFNSNDFEYFE